MPLFEYLCVDCGKHTETLVISSEDQPACQYCGGRNLKKMLSAHSSFSGAHAQTMPGPGDTACCGSSPTAVGCAGPGSCCGRG
ncbi:MAG: FmdB family zinc ribbon protein [Pseudomonadota bacterium]